MVATLVVIGIIVIIAWGLRHDGVLHGRCDAGDYNACQQLEAGYEDAKADGNRP
jgi:hypothetical protein